MVASACASFAHSEMSVMAEANAAPHGGLAVWVLLAGSGHPRKEAGGRTDSGRSDGLAVTGGYSVLARIVNACWTAVIPFLYRMSGVGIRGLDKNMEQEGERAERMPAPATVY